MTEPRAPSHGGNVITDCLRRGALAGSAAWLIYFFVENLIIALIPWLWPSQESVPHQPWMFLALLLGCYGLAGGLIGGLWGLSFAVSFGRCRSLDPTRSDRILQSGALICVLVLFALHIATQFQRELSTYSVLALCALIIAAAVGEATGRWPAWLRPAMSPWVLMVIAVGTGWLVLEVLRSHPRPVKEAVLIGYPLSVLVTALVIARLRSKWMRRPFAASSYRPRLVLPAVGLSMLGLYWAYAPRRPIDHGITSAASADSLPNIVLIILDTVRADHMSLYGHETENTPNLARFARQATVYHRAIAASDMTLASHASMFTGLYARTHGSHYAPPEYPYGAPLSDGLETLAEILSELGYATVGVVANHGYLHRGTNLNQGFQYWDDRRGVPLLTPAQRPFFRQVVFAALRRFMPQSAVDKGFRTAAEINGEVFRLLDRLYPADGPFFLFVNYMDAHWPYMPPSPYDTLVPGKEPSVSTDQYAELHRSVLSGNGPVPESWKRHLVSQYDGAIAYLDDHVARLIERLETRGSFRNTLIVITSDHGEAFGRRDLIGHSVGLYQDQIHVPLIVKWPGQKQGRTERGLVSHVDLFPTVVDLLGREAPQPLPGVSLLRLENHASRAIVSESYPAPEHRRWNERHDRVEHALFEDQWKLIASSTGKQELYSLQDDPEEKADLFRENPAQAGLMIDRLTEWLRRTGQFERKERDGDDLEVDEETLKRLRGLGYIQ